MNIALRPWDAADAPDLLHIYRTSTGLEHQLPALTHRVDARDLILENYRITERGAVWCITSDAVASGCVGILYEAKQPEGRYDRGWVYYWAAESIRGRGITSTCVRAVCDWAQPVPAVNDNALQRRGYDFSALDITPSPNLRRLELGYRLNNKASAAVARKAGFVVEGIEREKFRYDGILYDAALAARLTRDMSPTGL